MADKHVFEYLKSVLADPSGRKKWLDLKLKSRLVDLASADLTELDLRDFDFSEVVLSTAILLGADLTGADFSDAELSYADLRRAKLRNACMDRADLRSANLHGASLTDANLEDANLHGARLTEADLVGADLSHADLSGADLRGASLKYCRLTGAKLEGADVAEADLTGCVMDDLAPNVLKNFDLAVIDDRKYRVMRSRLNISGTTELIKVESNVVRQAEEGDKEDSKGRDSKSKLEKFKSKFNLKSDGPGGPEVLDYIARASDLDSETGWYRILGVEQGTPLAGVTKAFRQKAKKYHPDKTRHLKVEEQEFYREQFFLARQAYEKLSRLMAKPLVELIWVEGIPIRESAYDYSLEEYIKLAKANPKHCDVLYNLGWKYFDSGMFDEAIETYERVLSIHPKQEDAEYNLRVIKLCKTFEIAPDPALEGF